MNRQDVHMDNIWTVRQRTKFMDRQDVQMNKLDRQINRQDVQINRQDGQITR